MSYIPTVTGDFLDYLTTYLLPPGDHPDYPGNFYTVVDSFSYSDGRSAFFGGLVPNCDGRFSYCGTLLLLLLPALFLLLRATFLCKN
ncbi:hypothetical protein J32TS6_10500 [Virgibacillus pantothenticus]|nr:hypothetical protein J32TS6_10500 [Virgibacillus pantothenticus]